MAAKSDSVAFLAFDLGAESGRAMLATLTGDKVELVEAHRFANLPQRLPSGLHWNLGDLWGNLVQGLARGHKLAQDRGVRLVSVGVDTWGVDMALVGRSGQLLGLPFAYRDARHEPAMRKTLARVGEARIYDATGIQFMPFNTLYQLVAQHDAEPQSVAAAERLVNMPDLLHYFFSGKLVNEATIASTTQMIDPRPRNGQWATALLKDLGLPTHLLKDIVPAGTRIGRVRPEVLAEAGLPAEAALDVIVPGSHDTASAVAAVPVDDRLSRRWAYLSSGTWSLMGAELDEPIVSEASRAADFTNERCVGGKIRFLKNISGLWLVQECRRDFARQGTEYSYAELADLAAKSQAFRTLVDPAHGPFVSPGDMPAKIARFAQSTGQPAPQAPGQFVRCCLESLALTYRQVLEKLEGLLGWRAEVLHIVGGGGQNTLLNQMTADAIGRAVIVGPYEATAVGNALAQAIGAGVVRDLSHLRRIVRTSFDPVTYQPRDPAAFQGVWDRYKGLLGK